MDRLGHSTTVAAVRYQHVMADRDAAIARELNRLIEGRWVESRANGEASSVMRMEW